MSIQVIEKPVSPRYTAEMPSIANTPAPQQVSPKVAAMQEMAPSDCLAISLARQFVTMRVVMRWLALLPLAIGRVVLPENEEGNAVMTLCRDSKLPDRRDAIAVAIRRNELLVLSVQRLLQRLRLGSRDLRFALSPAANEYRIQVREKGMSQRDIVTGIKLVVNNDSLTEQHLVGAIHEIAKAIEADPADVAAVLAYVRGDEDTDMAPPMLFAAGILSIVQDDDRALEALNLAFSEIVIQTRADNRDIDAVRDALIGA